MQSDQKQNKPINYWKISTIALFILLILTCFSTIIFVRRAVINMPGIFEPVKPTPTTTGKFSPLTFIVIDAISTQPINNATVVIKETIMCSQAIGAECPKEQSWVKTTDEEGKAVFTDNSFKNYIEEKLSDEIGYLYFLIIANAPDYEEGRKEFIYSPSQPPEGVYFPENKDAFYSFRSKTFTIELIGGNIAVKNRETALSLAQKDAKVAAWMAQHKNVDPETAGVSFANSYWLVEYEDKDCITFQTEKSDCAITVQIDPKRGKVTLVEKQSVSNTPASDAGAREISWEECTKIPGSSVLLMYPGKCVTPDGRTAIQSKDANIKTPTIVESGESVNSSEGSINYQK